MKKEHVLVKVEFNEDYLHFKAGEVYEIKEPVAKKLSDKKIVKRRGK